MTINQHKRGLRMRTEGSMWGEELPSAYANPIQEARENKPATINGKPITKKNGL